MKILATLILSTIIIIGVMSFEILTPNGKAGMSGAPGCNNCTMCHSGTLNSGTATVSITAEPSLANGYTPGAVYTVSATIANSPSPNDKRFGIDLEALLASGANGGTIAITNSTLTKILTTKVGSNTRNDLVHTGNQNVGPTNQTFSFKWTAPAAGSGTITFYASLMAANNNGSESGDKVYSKTLVVPESSVGVLDNIQITNISIYPNPSGGKFQISVNDPDLSNNSNIEVYSSEGQLVYQSSMNNQTAEINLSNQAKGIYFVKVYKGGIVQSGKVIKL